MELTNSKHEWPNLNFYYHLSHRPHFGGLWPKTGPQATNWKGHIPNTDLIIKLLAGTGPDVSRTWTEKKSLFLVTFSTATNYCNSEIKLLLFCSKRPVFGSF